MRVAAGLAMVLAVLLLTIWATRDLSETEKTADGLLTLEGEHVVHYDWSDSPTLLNPVRVIKQGTHVEGGCEWHHEYSSGGVAPWQERELAYDPTTCRALFESGTPSTGG